MSGRCGHPPNLGMGDELRDYMIQIAENEHEENFRADHRFNALCLRMAGTHAR